ncbi:hypothetical protein GA0061098_1004182 [Bradyrhizobium shewense]|uniref:Uncharacterized protein n=1 Tax=Bradyrhizobium shewense TaxID=1761772 RepID=A0A1C3VFY9_9BRAD|nr:hypothetical protein GA0061098_1004182 [Bradyrhizobium shewense]
MEGTKSGASAGGAATADSTELCSKIVMCAGRIRKTSRRLGLFSVSAALPLGTDQFHDLMLVAGIRLPFLFHELLKLKSFYGKFIRQALKQLALFYVRCPLTHQVEFSGVRAELL